MKIVLAAASFTSHISGVQRHAFNMVRCLLQQAEVSTLHLVVAPWQRDLVRAAGLLPGPRLVTHIADMELSSLSRNLWYYQRLPELATRLHADVVHLTYPMPVDAASYSCPTVVTLHDLYPYEIPRNFGFPKFFFNRFVLQQCLRNVDAIACVSDITNALLKRYTPAASWRKAVRIYNCVEPERLCAIESPLAGWRGEPFLLCVAQHRRNKNIPLLLQTFARLRRYQLVDRSMKLVVIGITGPETERIRKLVAELSLDPEVRFLAGLSEPELQWCYTHCEMLAVPSRTEGFGLPVAEALLAGCRVVCSDIPAFREVGGDYCRFVSLKHDAVDELGHAIVATLRQPRQAPIALPQFSSVNLALQYTGLYRRLTAAGALAENSRLCAPLQTAPER
jgi:glycosyltransferase involved in cell wall biosynthesis